jgi:hypothetical protein
MKRPLMAACGNASGQSVDKFKTFGLTPEPASVVKAALIAECYSSLECKLADRKWRMEDGGKAAVNAVEPRLGSTPGASRVFGGARLAEALSGVTLYPPEPSRKVYADR